MPTGQVFRWQARIITQPVAISGAVAKPISSAPSSAAIDDVAARLQLPVGLHPDARAQVVQHQRLLRLGQPDLPRHAGVQDRRERRRAGAAVVAGDEDVVGVRLGDARGDRADADLGDELDRDARLRVRAAQVVDQLLQILDRVDVVVRRRRDQADARRRQPHARDVAVDLVPRQLAALAGLRALRHLDLELVGVRQVVDVDAEAARRDLLDLRAALVGEPHRVLAALAGVRASADPVHRDGERLVRLARERAERHRAGGEPLDDLRSPARPRRAGSPAPALRKRIRPRSVERRAESALTVAANSS